MRSTVGRPKGEDVSAAAAARPLLLLLLLLLLPLRAAAGVAAAAASCGCCCCSCRCELLLVLQLLLRAVASCYRHDRVASKALKCVIRGNQVKPQQGDSREWMVSDT
jgi:hypothetical protein